jgi:hypothetical protein
VIAGTVNGFNVPISSFDAALIAQKVVGICNVNNRSGQWIFATAQRCSSGRSERAAGRRIIVRICLATSMVIGTPLGPTTPGESNIAGGDPVKASIPLTRASSGSQVLIPLRIDDLRERTLNSLQFDIQYDPAIITPAGAGVTLEERWTQA